MVDFPTSLDNFTNPSPTDKLNNPSHSTQHQQANDAIEALEAKLGVGASTPTSGKVLRATGTGTTAYGQVDLTTDVASFTSANLRTALSDETGTGAAVFATSPTLTTPTIADFTNAQHDHGDADDGGALATGAVSSAGILATGVVTSPKLSTELQKGWEDSYGGTQFPAPSTVTYNGNRSYDLVFNSVDLTGAVSSGMRLRTTRSVVAPTRCTSLNGTTQSFFKTSPAGSTFTDDFAAGAWVKLSSYPSSTAPIINRYNSIAGSGWQLLIASTGQVQLIGRNASASNFSSVLSTQSVPLNKWVHVAAQLDMSAFTATPTTSYTMIEGIDVPATVARGGTNPTALVQSGDLLIGSSQPGDFFPGKIAQVWFAPAKVTQANALTIYAQGITAAQITSLGLGSVYSFDNSINDLNTTNANNLTASGSAVATNADSPFGTQADGTISSTLDYGITSKTAFSTNTTLTVQVPEGCTIPTSGGVSAVSYSSNKVPYGFPAVDNAIVEILMASSFSSTTIAGADIPALTTTLTPPTNKSLRVTAFGSMLKTGSAGDQLVLKIYEDSTLKVEHSVNMSGSNYAYLFNMITPSFKPTAGSHTYKATISSGQAGTMQFGGFAITQPAIFRVEVVDL